MTDLPATPRLVLYDIEAMPQDGAAQLAAINDLSTRDFGVWVKLRRHLWVRGSLPLGWAALAKIAGIGVPSFERAAPKLDRHFDRTREGAWTDDVLMQARGARPVVPSPEAPAVDPRLSATRRAAGAAGGRASVERRRELAASRDASGGAGPEAGHLLQPEAKREANEASKNGGYASGLVPPTRGWLVLDDDDLNETNQPTAPAGEATEQAKSNSLGQAKPENGAAPQMEDARRIEAILATCPGKIAQATAVWGLRDIKPWLTDGCDFDADFLSSLRAFGKTTSEVRHIANERIQKATFFARDRRLAATKTSTEAAREPAPTSHR